jgi:hypothetical protein
MNPGELNVHKRRDGARIRRALQHQVDDTQISALHWPVPLFEFFAATASGQFRFPRGMA